MIAFSKEEFFGKAPFERPEPQTDNSNDSAPTTIPPDKGAIADASSVPEHPLSLGLTINEDGTFGLVVEPNVPSSNYRAFENPDEKLYSKRPHYFVRTAPSPQSYPVHKRHYLWNTYHEKFQHNPMGWKLLSGRKKGGIDMPVAVIRLDWVLAGRREISPNRREISALDLLEGLPGTPASDTSFGIADEQKRQSLLSMTEGECNVNGLLDVEPGIDVLPSLHLALSALRRMYLPGEDDTSYSPGINFDLYAGEKHPGGRALLQLETVRWSDHIVEALNVFAKVAQKLFPDKMAKGRCTVWNWGDVWWEYKDWRDRWPHKNERKGEKAVVEFMTRMKSHEVGEQSRWLFLQ